MEIFDCKYVVLNSGILRRTFAGVYKNKRVPDVTKLDVKNAYIKGGRLEYEKLTLEMVKEKDPKIVKLAAIIAASHPGANVAFMDESYADLVVTHEGKRALIKWYDSPQKVTVSIKVSDVLENIEAEMYKLIERSHTDRESEDGIVTVRGIEKFFITLAGASIRDTSVDNTDEFIDMVRKTLFSTYDYSALKAFPLKDDDMSAVLDVLSAATYKLWLGGLMSTTLMDVYGSNISDDAKIAVSEVLLSYFPENINHYKG